MKLKGLSLTAVAAMAFTAFAATSASASTLEVGGVTKNSAVQIEANNKSGASMTWTLTNGSLGNTCTAAGLASKTETFTGTSVTGVMGISFGNCERPVTTHKGGVLHISDIGGTDGTVTMSGTELTVATPVGTINCKTGGGVDVGTLTGAASGNTEIHINAVINCGFLVPSATWKGTFNVYTPAGLGVSA